MVLFIVGLSLGIALATVVWWTALYRQSRLLRYITSTIEGIAQGKYAARVLHLEHNRARKPIVEAVNNMAATVEKEIGELSQERDVLQHILHSMTTGVVYIGRGGKIRMVNESAERVFRRPAEQWVAREHWAVFRHYNLGAAIDNALLFGTPWQSQLQLESNITIEVSVIPIQTSYRAQTYDVSGNDALVILNDVSEWRRLEQMRSEFVANVSHELKTPIAAIRGFAETLLDEDVEQADRKQFLYTIYEESHRMGMLVSDLLELSKLEGGRHLITPAPVELYTIVRRTFDRLKSDAETRHIQLDTTVQAGVTVWATEDKLLQVFLNLLSNAIHYTPDGGQVSVNCEVLIDRVKVFVKDTGIGIAKEHQTRVFERFYRVSRDRSRASGGTGLGLAIVKHIITLFGGEVGVDSQVGQGSTFWFTLSRLERTFELEES